MLIAPQDPSIKNLNFTTLGNYFRTLDIEELGDLSKLPDKPLIFTVNPLKANYASLDKGFDSQGNDLCTADDLWAIFATHVFELDDKTYDMSTEGDGKYKHLKDDCRDQFFEWEIRGIANCIRQLANGDGVTIPFAPPVGILEWISNQRRQSAKSQGTTAYTAVAKINESDGEISPKMETSPDSDST
jgi:hypothetical protein